MAGRIAYLWGACREQRRKDVAHDSDFERFRRVSCRGYGIGCGLWTASARYAADDLWWAIYRGACPLSGGQSPDVENLAKPEHQLEFGTDATGVSRAIHQHHLPRTTLLVRHG